MTFPWETEQLPAVQSRPIEDTVSALQRDVAYMVTHTAVLVHSKHGALSMLVNTPRGQIIPRNKCQFNDGSTIEFQDIGMPQIGAPEMTVRDLVAYVWNIATTQLGLELQP